MQQILEATKKVGKVLWDPDIPVGKANQQPSEIAITLLAEPDMNPNPDGEPSPVEMRACVSQRGLPL